MSTSPKEITTAKQQASLDNMKIIRFFPKIGADESKDNSDMTFITMKQR